MPYIGNTPAEKYAAFNVQHFTTSATTSYTLDRAIANELDIRLVINNVIQQPGIGKAYTASGTTLTLSGATTGTDTMYAVYIGKAIQTVTPGAGSVGTTALQDNAVTNAKLADATQGDVIYYGAAGAPAQLAAGTSGQVLKTQGAGANPIWAADQAGTITAFTNGVDNRLVTATSATALNGEANLSFSGSQLLQGGQTSAGTAGYAGTLQVNGVNDNVTVGINSFKNNDGGGNLVIGKSRNAASGSFTVLQNNDVIGAIRWAGDDGNDYESQAASIDVRVDGTPGSNDMPGRMIFSTTPDGAASPVEAMRINNAGTVTKPLQPAFMSLNGGGTTLANATDVTITLDTEVFDIGSNISGNTFTAPVTGKYYFSGSVVADAGSGNNTRFSESHIYINCSNRKLKFGEEQHYTNVNDWWAMSVSGLIDMDANDTCTLTYFGRRQSGSGTCVTVGSSTDFRTGLSGYLVC